MADTAAGAANVEMKVRQVELKVFFYLFEMGSPVAPAVMELTL